MPRILGGTIGDEVAGLLRGDRYTSETEADRLVGAIDVDAMRAPDFGQLAMMREDAVKRFEAAT
jgi:hypothetical protein